MLSDKSDDLPKNVNAHPPQQGIIFAQIMSKEMHQANASGLSVSQQHSATGSGLQVPCCRVRFNAGEECQSMLIARTHLCL